MRAAAIFGDLLGTAEPARIADSSRQMTSAPAQKKPADACKCLKAIGQTFGKGVAIPKQETKLIMIGAVEASSTDIYEAVIALSRSIAGRTDLRSLLSGVAESLRRIVRFNHIGMSLHDPNGNVMQEHILKRLAMPSSRAFGCRSTRIRPGWVWLNQQPLVISRFQSETRWPEAVQLARDLGIGTTVLVPLTAGDNRLGAFGFSSVAPIDPSPAELAFLERVASEFAVAVESFLARQAAVRERDRLRRLFDITNALVSKLSPDELVSAISAQLSRVIPHEFSVLMLRDETGGLEMVDLHFTGAPALRQGAGPR